MKFLEALGIVYRKKGYLLLSLISAFLIGWLMFFFTHYQTIKGNFGAAYANIDVLSQAIISILFGINAALLVFKINNISKSIHKDTGLTALGSFLGVIVAGCPACGLTLASYLGLASFIAVFPFAGLELKILGIVLLAYSLDSLSKNLLTCKIDFKKN